jgi:hypothetical protein
MKWTMRKSKMKRDDDWMKGLIIFCLVAGAVIWVLSPLFR